MYEKRQRVPDTVYVHCKAQFLNVAAGHAWKEPLLRCMLGSIQEIDFAFDYPPAKRLLAFQAGMILSRCGIKG